MRNAKKKTKIKVLRDPNIFLKKKRYLQEIGNLKFLPIRYFLFKILQ